MKVDEVQIGDTCGQEVKGLDEGQSGLMLWTLSSDELDLSPGLAERLFPGEAKLSMDLFRGRIVRRDLALFDQAVVEALESQTALTVPIALTSPKRSRLHFLVRMRQRVSRKHQSAQLICRLTDISDIRSELELALEAQLASDEANRMKTEFLGNISHELRTPLNGVLGMAQLLDRTELSERQQTFIDKLKASGNALLSIIDDVLDITRIEAGRLTLDEEAIDIAAMLHEVSDAAMGLAAAKRLDLKWQVAPELREETLLGDRKRISQVILNLVGNAVKFTDSGSITVAARPARRGVRFEVRDTGPGVPPEMHKLIFERFRQGENEDGSVSRGTGLGLAISRELVETMGGTIGVESVPGEGSTFYFTLPPPDHAEAAEETPGLFEPKDRASEQPLRTIRVLLAEDSPVNREVVEELLGFEGGFTVTSVSNGREALDALDRARFDAIILDINMPVMGGDEALGQMRRSKGQGATIPVVVLSANALKQQQQHYLDLGADFYLPKPLDGTKMVEVLRGLCRQEEDELQQSAG